MNTLTELYNQQIVPLDQELEKQASELVKQAEEEEFAGRIMARGFADELNKLAQPSFDSGPAIKPMSPGKTVPVKGPAVKYGPAAQKSQGGMPGRKAQAPGGGPSMNMAPMAIGGKKGPSVGSPFSAPKPAGAAGPKPQRLAGGPK